ncbi:MAG: penicillin-binding protein [Curvibacter sp.]|nr:MAG: penicillin-binding protein [Curvibacter sp.]
MTSESPSPPEPPNSASPRPRPALARLGAALRRSPTQARALARALTARLNRRRVALALAAVPAALLLYTLLLIPFTPSIQDIRKANQERPAQILSADGKLITEFKRANREWVPLKRISPHVVDALIATEDHRFYQHHGLDWRRLGSAALSTFGGSRQGGSTLTQQLARNLYPDEVGRAPTLTRKLKEAITAVKLEIVYSKPEILETYLNTVPFLYNAFGIEMAARTYFDSSADALDVLQSATLVGMLKGNSYYNPVLNPERAQQRRNIVLAQMVKRDKLSPTAFEALKGRPLRIDFERQTEPPGPAAHFAQQVRKWLVAWADRNDYNIYSDGLVVRTTLDSRLQALANQAVQRQAGQLQRVANAAWAGPWSPKNPLVQGFMRDTPAYRNAQASGLSDAQALKKLQADTPFMRGLLQQKTLLQAGFLAIDPRNAQVRAWVGSRDFEQDAYDHVQQARRQPGSTFKPFVYGEAFRQGMSPDDTLLDQSIEIAVGRNEVWRPSDESPPSGRPMSLRDGLAYSKNTITAQLVQKVGPPKVARLARALGVRQSKLEEVPSIALGTSLVSLKEMVNAYASIAHQGRYLEPVLVTRIEDREGHVIEDIAPARPEAALPERVAYTLIDTLRGVVDRGTGTDIRNRWGIRADVAGKTGTTQDNTDGWFILMHPQLVAGAWVGFNDSRITLRSDYWGQGAHSALPIVGDVVSKALRARWIDGKARFEPPDDSSWLQRLWRRARESLWQQLQDQAQGLMQQLLQHLPRGLWPQPAKAPARPPAPVAPASPPAPPPAPDPQPDPLQKKIDDIITEPREESPAPQVVPQTSPPQPSSPQPLPYEQR